MPRNINRSSAMIGIIRMTSVAVCAALCGCPTMEPPPDTAGDGNGEAVSYSAQIQPILTDFCAGCHSSGGVADLAGIDLRLTDDVSYDLLIDQSSVQDPALTLVVAGEANSSLLFLKVSSDSPPVGVRMPRSLPPLDQSQIDLIREWIEQGAPDN